MSLLPRSLHFMFVLHNADTMALQEQSAASKVKELSKRLESTEKDKKAVEEQLRTEQVMRQWVPQEEGNQG